MAVQRSPKSHQKMFYVNISFLSPGWTTQGTKEAVFWGHSPPHLLKDIQLHGGRDTTGNWFLSTAAFSCSSTSCHSRPCTALMFAGTGWRQKVDLGQVWLGDGQGQLVKVLARHFLQIRAWQKAYSFSCL